MNARTVTGIARDALGGGFALFGLNGFLNFLPAPPTPAAASAFVSALFASGYFFPLLKGTEIVAGVLLLGNRFVPLALTLLAPVLVNIVAFHAFLAPAGLPIPIVLAAGELYLAWSYRDAFAPMLRAESSRAIHWPSRSRRARRVQQREARGWTLRDDQIGTRMGNDVACSRTKRTTA